MNRIESVVLWKPKSERPLKQGSYLVKTKNGAVFITHYHKKFESFSTKRIDQMITHWAEKPK